MVFRNMDKLFLTIILALFIAIIFSETVYAQSSWKPAGVHADNQKAMIVDKELRTGYEQVNKVLSVTKPGGVAFSSCFAEAAELNAKGSGELFSNDYSKQVALPINEGLEAVKDAFSFDKTVDYSANVAASVGITASLGLKAIGNDKGPTVKGLKCPEVQKKWMQVRSEEVKETPPYSNALKKDFASGVDSKWEEGIDSLSSKIDEREKLSDKDSRTILLFEGPDIPFNSREDFCKLLGFMGVKGDCAPDEMNKRKTK